MAKNKSTSKRLPRTFHSTFIPERHYIAEILRYAAAGNEGTYQDIRDATSIPMGEQSGKVQPILEYCRGMGLVVLDSKRQEAVKRPRLTAFGRKVFLEDRYLKEPISQWVAHLNLCSPLTGADLWYQAFCQAAPVLGMRFARERLDDYLKLAYSSKLPRADWTLVENLSGRGRVVAVRRRNRGKRRCSEATGPVRARICLCIRGMVASIDGRPFSRCGPSDFGGLGH